MSMVEVSLRAAETLGETMRPIAEHIWQHPPDMLFVCQRNAQPMGIAFEALAEHHDQSLPPVYYRRISKQLRPAALDAEIEEPMHTLRDPRAARIAILDDYISSSAGTRHAMREALGRHGVLPSRIGWYTLCGTGATVSIRPHAGPLLAAPWREIGRLLGLQYDKYGSVYEAPTALSRQFYNTIRRAILGTASGDSMSPAPTSLEPKALVAPGNRSAT